MAQFLEDREALLATIRRLPAERQELLILKFVERLSNKEIGDIMDRSEGAIKSLYHRTLLSLREEIQSKQDRAHLGKEKRGIFRYPWGNK